MSQYLTYWKPASSDSDDDGVALDHTAGEQLKKCEPGDILWIVTVREGELLLKGRLTVGEIVDQKTAEHRLKSTNLWEASWHAIAKKGTIEPLRIISLASVVPKLRFESPIGSDRLIVKNGKVSGLQLQQMRKLTPTSILLLESMWGRKNSPIVSVPTATQFKNAFRGLKEVTDQQVRILRLHYHAEDRTITSTQAADVFGVDVITINNQYGRLAKAIRKATAFRPTGIPMGTLGSVRKR